MTNTDWEISFLKSAEREFSKIPQPMQKKIRDYLVQKALPEPRMYGKALVATGKIKLWRYRVQDYRIISQIKDNELTVLVVKISKRDKVYKG